MITVDWQPFVTLTYDDTQTYTYTGDNHQPYPGYMRVIVPEDPAEETLITPLIGYAPTRSGYTIGYLSHYDHDGNVISPPEPPTIPPPDGRWTVDS